MYQFKNQKDTIAAISTGMGSAGIGIVRLSGQEAIMIADKMFLSKRQDSKPSVTEIVPSQFKSHTVHYGYIVDRKIPHHNLTAREDRLHIVDEVLLTVMRSPHTYTREDVVEISSHGGIVPLKTILHIALTWGARMAEPGEFTKRAFLNGRIDLTQAEAVLDIIHSRTDAFLRISTHQLKGDLRHALDRIREQLMNIYVELEAIVNFPEDDVEQKGQKNILDKIKKVLDSVSALLQTGEQGRILKEGMKIVICGRPNVGKSSLLNALLKQPRAIVSDLEGTTRDTIEETAQIKGIPFQLIDTAGILKARDLVEEEAVKRSHLSIQCADVILLILDASRPLSAEDGEIADKVFSSMPDDVDRRKQRLLVVMNKCDLPAILKDAQVKSLIPYSRILHVSSRNRKGIDQLEEAIVELALQTDDLPAAQGVMISNLRHINSLQECEASLKKAEHLFHDSYSVEFISEEIKAAVNHLDDITGRNIDGDLLDNIFARFCIGK